MKKMVVLYSPSKDGFAHEKIFNNISSTDRAITWADSFNSGHCVIYGDDVSVNGKTNLPLLIEKIDTVLSENSADYAVFAWADCPFLNKDLTEKLIEYHEKYRAEYTFADGFPYGLSPELIHAGTIKLLLNIAKTKGFEDATIERDSIFSVIKTDINSFEIETYIADHDWRYLRLQLCCSSKRNTLACERLFDIAEQDILDANALSFCAEKSASVQRTLPAFYAIQTYSSAKLATVYEPSLGDYEMDITCFESLVKKISAFSDDAIISLSLLGDPLYHKDFLQFVKVVLSTKNIGLLIETDGLNLTKDLAESICELVSGNPILVNGQRALNWIIRIDANDSAMYNKVHLNNTADESFEKAVSSVLLLKELFPHAVYPQMVRMKCNEDQLEGFFRKWVQEGNDELIIQKFDPLSGLLDDMRSADLSPAKRYACWHIKRDMNILHDGTVVRCKAAAFSDDKNSAILGNAFEEDLSTIWARGEKNLANQLEGIYTGQCGESDEYYTFNF